MPAIEASEGLELGGETVGAKCDDKTATGHWMCLTHVIAFPNNFTMQGHVDEGEHLIAWVCHAHGLEVP